MKEIEESESESEQGELKDILVQLKEFEFADECETPHKEFKKDLESHIDMFRRGISEVIRIQKRVNKVISETEDLMELSKRLKDHEKISQAVQEYISELDIQKLTDEYTTVLRTVSEYRDLFKGLRNIERYMCSVCLEATVDTFLDPCGHTVCSLCADRIGKKCPYCRGTIFKSKRLLFS
jgi:rubrerythrin